MFELRRSERVIEMVIFTNPEGVSFIADELCHSFGIKITMGIKASILSSLRDYERSLLLPPLLNRRQPGVDVDSAKGAEEMNFHNPEGMIGY